MINITIKSDLENKVRKERATLLIALRDLMYEDAAKMENLGNDSCNYCAGNRESGDGHSDFCSFADAVEILFQKRATIVEDMVEETKVLRTALTNLAADDYLLMKDPGPCTYCHGIYHTPECALHNAILALEATRVT